MIIKQKSLKTKTKKRRVGRGYGSGKGGHTSGRGMKGQRSRSGFKRQKAWLREANINSLPKLRGIGKRSNRKRYEKAKLNSFVLNVSDLDKLRDGEVVTQSFLKSRGLIKSRSKKVDIKILGEGNISKKITVKGIKTSEMAQEKIEKAGGTVI